MLFLSLSLSLFFYIFSLLLLLLLHFCRIFCCPKKNKKKYTNCFFIFHNSNIKLFTQNKTLFIIIIFASILNLYLTAIILIAHLPCAALLPEAIANIVCKLIRISSENQVITISLRVSISQHQSRAAIN